MAREGCFSWTSETYEDDVLAFIAAQAGLGSGIVEVGCYKGGLSAQLVYMCEKLGWPYYGIDIDPGFLEITINLLAKVGLGTTATFFAGTLNGFAKQVRLVGSPLAVVLDGDHALEAVKQDIASLYALNRRSHAAIFHDYSLRHPTTGEAVDQAIQLSFGNRWPIQRIGQQHDGSTTSPTKAHPQPDGHYWEVPGSEGAIVLLPEHLTRE